jgi:hypothetical protein
MRQWMKNLFWSMVLWVEEVWSRRGRTRETSEEALEEAEAVCSARTVVLWAMHALDLLAICYVWMIRHGVSVLEQRRRS